MRKAYHRSSAIVIQQSPVACTIAVAPFFSFMIDVAGRFGLQHVICLYCRVADFWCERLGGGGRAFALRVQPSCSRVVHPVAVVFFSPPATATSTAPSSTGAAPSTTEYFHCLFHPLAIALLARRLRLDTPAPGVPVPTLHAHAHPPPPPPLHLSHHGSLRRRYLRTAHLPPGLLHRASAPSRRRAFPC
ncbi:hypothetical protein K402DRAFT_106233 [Aulographum hederae CBS 113979]|uniref:Uncharacterized protein n=1 Tax=Aulographum hederae CBS 113979 TaxID=1176131 RepID=A0A6G1GY44_9PEZI|nr:hypothetical protein K402DRAFT_106233 [Aulographum hederae CBS 113979]